MLIVFDDDIVVASGSDLEKAKRYVEKNLKLTTAQIVDIDNQRGYLWFPNEGWYPYQTKFEKL